MDKKIAEKAKNLICECIVRHHDNAETMAQLYHAIDLIDLATTSKSCVERLNIQEIIERN